MGRQRRLFKKRTLNTDSNTEITKVIFCLTCLNTPSWLTEELKIPVVFCQHDLQPEGIGIYKRWLGGLSGLCTPACSPNRSFSQFCDSEKLVLTP